MLGAGADLQLLLSGLGVHYATQTRRQPALRFDDWQQKESADISRDIANLIDTGVPVFAVREDLAARRLSELPLINGVELVSRQSLANIYEGVDQVWHW